MFELINSRPGLSGDRFQPDPYEEGPGDGVRLDGRLATLASFQTGPWLACVVQLLDFPTEATQLLGGLRGFSGGVVGHDPIGSATRFIGSSAGIASCQLCSCFRQPMRWSLGAAPDGLGPHMGNRLPTMEERLAFSARAFLHTCSRRIVRGRRCLSSR